MIVRDYLGISICKVVLVLEEVLSVSFLIVNIKEFLGYMLGIKVIFKLSFYFVEIYGIFLL